MRTLSPWYQEILERVNVLASSLNLTDEQKEDLTNFSLSLAKEQFCAGNRSGITWARNQMREANTPCPECFATDGQHLRSSCTE